MKPGIATCLWFDNQGEDAARLYCGLVPQSRILSLQRVAPDDPGAPVLLVEFELMGQRYVALNGGPHYQLSPAVSIQAYVEDQAMLDRLWDGLVADGGREMQCGWLVDRFGLSWQIVPTVLPRLMQEGGEVAERVMRAMFTMVRLDIAALEAAARGPTGPAGAADAG